MIIKIKALTDNALSGIVQHYNECNTLKNKLKLRQFGVKQTLNISEKYLNISYENIITKVSNKLVSISDKLQDFKVELKDDQKKEFLFHVNNFMTKQNVFPYEYEVTFQ
jgi:hypothetical protein